MVARAGTQATRARVHAHNKQNIHTPSNTSAMRSTPGTARLGFLTLPALGLAPADGSERVALGRGRRDSLDGGGARVGLFWAAWLIVSMTDDWRVAIEVSGLAAPALVLVFAGAVVGAVLLRAHLVPCLALVFVAIVALVMRLRLRGAGAAASHSAVDVDGMATGRVYPLAIRAPARAYPALARLLEEIY